MMMVSYRLKAMCMTINLSQAQVRNQVRNPMRPHERQGLSAAEAEARPVKESTPTTPSSCHPLDVVHAGTGMYRAREKETRWRVHWVVRRAHLPKNRSFHVEECPGAMLDKRHHKDVHR